MEGRTTFWRVVLDTSVLLGPDRREVVTAAYLHYYVGFWSTWIAAEFARKRTEWVAERAIRDRCGPGELRRRLAESRNHVNAALAEFFRVLQAVNHTDAPDADLSWLTDLDDRPVIQTALAARADILLTENATDFPIGDARNGILILSARSFLRALYERFPEAETAVREYLQAM